MNASYKGDPTHGKRDKSGKKVKKWKNEKKWGEMYFFTFPEK